MGFNVKMGPDGVMGVTNLVAGEVRAVNNNSDVALNSVNILTDGGALENDFTLNLPVSPVLPGSVIEFKNLLTAAPNTITLTNLNLFVTVRQEFLTTPNATRVTARVNNDNRLIMAGDLLMHLGDTFTVRTARTIGTNRILDITTFIPGRLLRGDILTTNRPGNTAANNVVITQGGLTETINVVAGQLTYPTTVAFNPLLPVTAMLNGTQATNAQYNQGGVATVTVNRNGSNIDGSGTDITTRTRNQIFRLTYINENIGWLVT